MITQDELKQQLSYNPETGIFTRKISYTNATKPGCVAGGRNTQGYISISLFNKHHLAHRLAWLYTYGEYPSCQIDHINGVRCDNRIVNLRQANNSQNNVNVGRRSTNSSGYKGVCKSGQKWRAYITDSGHHVHLGSFCTPEEASLAYQSAAKKLHGEFYRSEV